MHHIPEGYFLVCEAMIRVLAKVNSLEIKTTLKERGHEITYDFCSALLLTSDCDSL